MSCRWTTSAGMAADLCVIVTTEEAESPLGGGLPVIPAGDWSPANLRGVPSGDDGTAAEAERLSALPLKIMGGSDAVIREPAPPTGQVPRMVTAAVLGLLVVVTVVTRLHTYGEPLERDLATYAVIAHELSDGRRLYSDLWDHKPPATHLTYAAAQTLAGVGPGSVYLLGVLTALATLLGVFWAGGTRRPGAVTGLWAAAFWTVAAGDLTLQANQPNTEVFLNACLIWAFALLAGMHGGRGDRARVTAVALLLALATLYKPVVAVCGVFLVAAHLALPPGGATGRRRAVADAALIVAICGAAWLSLVGYFAMTHRLADFTGAVFAYNGFYADNLIWNLFQGLEPSNLLPGAMGSLLPLVTASLLGLTLVRWGRVPRRTGLLLALAASVLVAIAAPGKFYAHYYQLWLPVLAVGAAWALAALDRVAGGGTRVLHAGGVLLLGVLAMVQLPSYSLPAEGWAQTKYGAIVVDTERTGRVIDRLLRPDETFYHWGSEAGLYLYSGHRPPTGVLFIEPLLEGPSAAALTRRVLADLAREAPELVVVRSQPGATSLPAHPVVRWILSRYRPLPEALQPYQFLLLARSGGALERRLNRRAPGP